MILVGGGAIPLTQHWRTVAVSETIKLNKLMKMQKLPISRVIKLLLEKYGAKPQTVADFMEEAATLDELFTQSGFILRAWSKQQVNEQKARNSGKKKKSFVKPSNSSYLESSPYQMGNSPSQGSNYSASPNQKFKIKKIYGSGGGSHTPLTRK